MNYPLVSIIIPYRINRGYLSQAIESIHSQNYPGAIEIIQSNHDAGVSFNINRGIEKASGEFIKYLCEDDWLPVNSIKDSVEGIQGHDFIHGKAYGYFHQRKIVPYEPPIKHPTLEQNATKNVIHGGSLMYRMSVFERLGLFDESLDCAEELEMNLRCLQAGMSIGYVDKFLYYYRRHEQQKSLGKGVNQMVRSFKINQINERFRTK
jgi:glycosyltransferase involved in cell wall biosynthesis